MLLKKIKAAAAASTHLKEGLGHQLATLAHHTGRKNLFVLEVSGYFTEVIIQLALKFCLIRLPIAHLSVICHVYSFRAGFWFARP